MNTLLALLLSSVSLTWVQPPNPGWAASCGTAPCLSHYTIVDSPAGTTYSVPNGATSFTVTPVAPGMHNFTLTLGGINSAGTGVSSTPAATTAVMVPSNVINVCAPQIMNTPIGTIPAGGQSKVVTASCAGAIAATANSAGDSVAWSFAGQPPSYGGLTVSVWVSAANQISLLLGNITGAPIRATVAVPLTVRCIR